MNNRTFFFSIVVSLSLFICSHAGAGPVQQFQLKDGSVVTGELLSFGNGVFTIKSGSLGVLKIDESRVRSFGGGSAAGSGDQMSAIRQQMQGDAGIMKMITALQNDPELMKALENPEFMRAVQSGDLGALQGSSLMNDIMNNSDIKKIVEEMTAK